ncbi:bifunctional glutamate N-acetyltransferase/amino-acid acetyltransferase ArgJ [Paenibacillus sp.]|jgi:glutamate N-acetyltransferase/amino-acid N-acetyltransferase|uniref:bifunctional glutamate N-acetyltransferase/amino-acid acetyltransferase ArgJ n=1 Tax=Paenibacillus sp. TaxID=58172 RepID=UPI002834B20B|nr:bifunctional glutamate N-acetyltransferase/amino-acid acetyltransferase ArgJ [Paenibacillus sp.]MDR0268696.1 bifunctional glutamate N-acetyltransferase/amino-acid acetyltransferase ArgJ [Paenibacillus sp.]
MGQGKYTVVQGGSIITPKGFSAGGLHCGLKKTERHDLGAILCEVPAVAAAVYTTNVFQAAPLKVTRESLQDGRLQAVIVNSGNANACTGKQGEDDAYTMRAEAARHLGVAELNVAVASTGVIGELLKMDRVTSGIAGLPQRLKRETSGAGDFSQAILTTDLVKKEACVSVVVNGQEVTIAGAAKGSGMIHPNMATMLAFMTTDAVIETDVLQRLLRQATDLTFNMITVDGDTSTNDMLLSMASGLAGNEALSPSHPDWQAFASGFTYVCQVLAQAIARDGEGATKLVEVNVNGAVNDLSARAIAKTVVGSSLVKSAVFGADANWGRIIAAVGRAGEPVNPETVDIHIGDILVLEGSRPVAFDEDKALEYLKGDTVRIVVDLHHGEGRATAWGCDLTYDYVRINAAYRT